MTESKSPEEPKPQRGKAMVKAVIHVLVLIGGLALYILFGLVLWWALNQYIDPQNSSQKRDVVQALALLMAGVAAAVGIYFTWRGQGITREGQQISRENIEVTRQSAEEQVRLTQEGQSTERFTRAIEQLAATDDEGAPRLEVRLAAIYELEQISRVSEVLLPAILEVLTAYVRENAPWSPQVDDPSGSEREPSARIPFSPPSSDIRAILIVLGRRVRYFEDVELEPLDLQGTDLGYSSLAAADLEEANFNGSNLQVADLRSANLHGAILHEVNLQEANLHGARLQGAMLEEANLQEARLFRANLQEATLLEAFLYGANLWGANLHGAVLQEAYGLDHEMIKWTIGSNETVLPEDLPRPELWSKSNEEQVKIIREHMSRD